MRIRRYQRNHPILRIFLLLIMTIVMMMCGYGVRIYSQTKVAVHKTYDNKVVKKKVVNLAAKKPFSVLLLGTDTGALGRSEKGRTDTMILVTVNPKANRTTMVSIPRDTLSYVQSSLFTGATKINSQYTYNDVKGAVDAVTTMFNVPINYYALVNMGGLEQIVDAVGGVDVNVAFSWSDPYSQGTFSKGPAHLNGQQALAYARMRHQDPTGDYGRQKRQQEVVAGIVKQALSATTLSHYGELMDSLSDNLRTNLSFNELVTLANDYRDSFKTITQDHVSEIGTYINLQSFQVPSTVELQRVSDLVRGELGLPIVVLDNYNTKSNARNAQNGFNWNSEVNPRYLVD